MIANNAKFTLDYYDHILPQVTECNDHVAKSTIQDGGFLGICYVVCYIVYSIGVRKIGQVLFLGIHKWKNTFGIKFKKICVIFN